MTNVITAQKIGNQINDVGHPAGNPFSGNCDHAIFENMDEHERLSKFHYAVDAERVARLIGFRPPAGPWLPLNIIRNVLPPCADLLAKLDPSPIHTFSSSDIAQSPPAQIALANLYSWFACYGATRCLVPLDPSPWPQLTALIRNAHLAIPGSPPLGDVKVEFIGASPSPAARGPATPKRRYRIREQKRGSSTPFPTDIDHVEIFKWAREQHDGHYEISTTVDPKLMNEMLGFRTPRGFRLPLDPVRSLLKAEREAHAYCVFAGPFDDQLFPTPEGIFSHPLVNQAVRDLYALLTIFGATRCPVPVGPKVPGLRDIISFFLEHAHLAVPNAPRLNVPIVFIGKAPPD